jgi:hypothetical protein
MVKGLLVAPDSFGASNLTILVGLLNQIDIPQELLLLIQDYIDILDSQLDHLTESAWGEDI